MGGHSDWEVIQMSRSEKSLPEGADGDDSVIISNGAYSIDVGETESGTWIWEFDGHATLYHEFFALQQANGEVYRSYREADVEEYFPDTQSSGEPASALLSMTVDGVDLLIKRTVRMDEEAPTFTMKYDIANAGTETVTDIHIFQYGDFDDGPSDYYDDVGEYVPDGDVVYVRDGDGDAYAGFSADRESIDRHVGSYPAYSEVENDNLNNRDRYPTGSGVGDAVAVLKWLLGDLSPGESTSITLQFGAETSESDLTGNVEEPDSISTTPPISRQSGSTSVISWVPGLSENDDEGGNDRWSAFPDEGPLPFLPIDDAFVGDQRDHDLPRKLSDALEHRKSIQGLEGEYRPYRFKNTVEVSFETASDRTIDRPSTIDVSVNGRLPDEEGFAVEVDGERPEFTVGLLDSDDPEPVPTTVIEENIEESVNASLIDLAFDERTRVAHDRERFLTVTVDEFSFRGETIEGVRVATLWGAENPYTHEISMVDRPILGWLPGSNPIIYSWIDLVVLADGTHAVRIQDTTQFPMHTLYTGVAGDPDEQYRRTDSGLEIIYDTGVTTDGEYAAAVNENNHEPWSQFFESFDDNTTYVPYRTPRSRYIENHNNDSTGRWIGFKNELLVDHPVMVYGETGDGESLSDDEATDILPSPQAPFPGLL